MKEYVIVAVKDGKITLTKEDFQEYLKSAFNDGFREGCNFASQRCVVVNPNKTYDNNSYKTYDNNSYEKIPYCMRPDFKSEVTCTGEDSNWKDTYTYLKTLEEIN